MPTLVTLVQQPGGSLALMEDELPSKCKIEIVLGGIEANRSVHEEIYSIPANRTTHPRYCLIVERGKGSQGWYQTTVWEIIEVEVDLGIPGPIKGISGVSTPVQSGVGSFSNVIEHKKENANLYCLPVVPSCTTRSPFLSLQRRRSVPFPTIGPWGHTRCTPRYSILTSRHAGGLASCQGWRDG